MKGFSATTTADRLKRSWALIASAVLTVYCSGQAHADVVIGVTNSNNCVPFTCAYNGIYQQVYSSSAFSSTTLIDTVSFFRTDLGPFSNNLSTGSISIAFYLTSAPVDGLSNNPTDNRTVLLSAFGGYVQNEEQIPDVLSFTGAPFLYDPSLGNLLLDVTANTTSAGDFGALQSAADSSDQTSRLTTARTDTEGLVTRFSAVPEPTTWSTLLFGFGLIGVALGRKRRTTIVLS